MTTLQQSFIIDTIKIDDAVFNNQLQDEDISPDHAEQSALKSKFFKASNNHKYKNLWKLSKSIIDKLKASRQRFPRFPNNRDTAREVQTVAKIIYELRNNVDGTFVLSQDALHTKIVSIWGKDNESGGPTMKGKGFWYFNF